MLSRRGAPACRYRRAPRGTRAADRIDVAEAQAHHALNNRKKRPAEAGRFAFVITDAASAALLNPHELPQAALICAGLEFSDAMHDYAECGIRGRAEVSGGVPEAW